MLVSCFWFSIQLKTPIRTIWMFVSIRNQVPMVGYSGKVQVLSHGVSGLIPGVRYEL